VREDVRTECPEWFPPVWKPLYSRDSFYCFRNLRERGGELVLAWMMAAMPNLENRMASEVEAAVVETPVEQPPWGKARVANELRQCGIEVSPSACAPSGCAATWPR
jgi:hypothetical protein